MRYLEDSILLEYNSALCSGCGMCTVVCPHAVFKIENKRAVLADKGACMECGACAKNCEQKAIKVRPGVGCAAAVLNSRLKKKSACECGGNSPCCG